MKLTVTIEISPETAEKHQITYKDLCTFGEELKRDAIRTCPEIEVTITTVE